MHIYMKISRRIYSELIFLNGEISDFYFIFFSYFCSKCFSTNMYDPIISEMKNSKIQNIVI